MKTIIFVVLSSVSVVSHAEWCQEAKAAIRDGAEAKYIYRVVDDDGVPVSKAIAHVWFTSYGRPQDNADWKVMSDTNGMFTVRHRFNERFLVKIHKDGYYDSSDEIFYLGMKEFPVKDGKWQPYGEMRTIVLKEMHSPGKLIVFSNRLLDIVIPRYNQWLGFDLEKGDWTSPNGAGTEEDVLFRFEAKINKRYTDFYYAMEVSFTNQPYAGAYLQTLDQKSVFKTSAKADDQHEFLRSFKFSLEAEPGRKMNVKILDKQSYLVFRSRTRIDEEGKLISAHYGTIIGDVLFDAKGLTIRDGCFNPVPNDRSIEDSRILRMRLRECQNSK